MTPEQKIQRLIKLLELTNEDYASKAEIGKIIQSLLGFLNDYKASFDKVLEDTKRSVSSSQVTAYRKLAELVDQTDKEIRAKYATDSETLKTYLTTTAQRIEQQISEIRNLIPLPVDLLPLKREIEEVRGLIPTLPPEKLGEDYRNALEALPNGEKLSGKAAIEEWEDLNKRLDELSKRPIGGMTDRGLQHAMSRVVKQETPSGVIDGANQSFTVSSTIHAVLSFELNSRVVALGEYTITGSKRMTIVFDTAIPASYSGKSFVITYL
jgi:hypothetical protein